MNFRNYLESKQSGFPHSQRHIGKRSKEEELQLQKQSPIFKNTKIDGWENRSFNSLVVTGVRPQT